MSSPNASPLDFSTQEHIASQTQPGVTLIFHKALEGYRMELIRRAAPARAELRRINREISYWEKQEQEPAEPPPALNAERPADKLTELSEQIFEIMTLQLKPLWIEVFFVGAEGITINGEPLTAANVPFAPRELYLEIVDHIGQSLGMPEAQIKNSESPTTSTGSAGGKMSDTTAPSAASSNSTGLETVPASIQD